MLGLRNAGVVGCQGVSLHSPDDREAHATREVGILAEVLLGPSPAGISGDVEDGAKDHRDSDGSCLRGDGSSCLLGEVLIPRRGESDALWEDRLVHGLVTVESFFDEEGGDA